jgi:hypothetical protein
MTNTTPAEIECPSCGRPVALLGGPHRPYIATHALPAPSKPNHLKPECSASRTLVRGSL